MVGFVLCSVCTVNSEIEWFCLIEMRIVLMRAASFFSPSIVHTYLLTYSLSLSFRPLNTKILHLCIFFIA